MEIYSYSYFAIWLISLIIYYSFGKRWQWQVLSLTSIVIYVLSIQKVPLVLIMVSLVSYSGGCILTKNMNKRGKIYRNLSIIICIVLLILGRTTDYFALLGNSYFTLKAIGYLLDVYRGKKVETNFFKYLLFLIYWPTVFEGPFNRISSFTTSFNKTVVFDYNNFVHGIQRFVWGTFKKLIIAERLSLFVTTVLTNPYDKGGRFIIIAVISYAIQIYADFSGFMDMMLGISLTFGIELPENFRQPYFAKTIPEFWRRWHITLGVWFRDYVMFPFTSWSLLKKVSKAIRAKNKTIGKLFPMLIGTCIIWFLTGIWHGLNNNYIIWGGYYALLICLSQIYSAIKKQNNKQKNSNFVIDLLCVCRTITLVLIADTIICVQGFSNIIVLWKEILLNFNGGSISYILKTGFNMKSAIIVCIGCLIMFLCSIIKEKGFSPQIILDDMPLVFRWGVYYILIFSILIWGLYGSEYDTSQFLYMQF